MALSLRSFSPEPPSDTRQRLLRFPLNVQDSALLPLEQITEILKLDRADILPIPETPNCVLGVCNWRGEMLWLIDLGNLVGYPPLVLLEQGAGTVMAIVIKTNDQSLGLAVRHVNDIEFHDLQTLHLATPGLFPPGLLPFVLGALPGGNGAVLNVTAIMQCPLWQTHLIYSRT
ncbi:MAG: chemotaxis protein CheW [Cyanobacteria bacterium CRU_2_1]|nr:chemotaxis protein CheW [Cyanobacteria bacterium RU_5_0]NJR60098.1 chemotaxis protein CheW [Cyanobacteria bacterium CRU_2_1]